MIFSFLINKCFAENNIFLLPGLFFAHIKKGIKTLNMIITICHQYENSVDLSTIR